jgi:hypothetical protein
MPYPANVNAGRDDITNILTSRADQSPMAQMAAAIPSVPQALPPGLPATPAGGVPGSGMPPVAPSNLALPQRPQGQQGMSLPLTGMGTMPELAAGGMGGMGGMPLGAPQGMPMGPPQGGMGMPQGMPQMQGRRPRIY